MLRLVRNLPDKRVETIFERKKKAEEYNKFFNKIKSMKTYRLQ